VKRERKREPGLVSFAVRTKKKKGIISFATRKGREERKRGSELIAGRVKKKSARACRIVQDGKNQDISAQKRKKKEGSMTPKTARTLGWATRLGKASFHLAREGKKVEIANGRSPSEEGKE